MPIGTWAGGITISSDTGEPPWTCLSISPRHYRGMEVLVENTESPKGWKRVIDPSLWLDLTPAAARKLHKDLTTMIRHRQFKR